MGKPARLMLDTSVCIEMLRAPAHPSNASLDAADAAHLSISSIVLAELLEGPASATNRAAEREKLDRLVRSLTVEPFGEAAAERYGEVRAKLKGKGRMIGAMDLLIGAHALALDAAVVTLDTADFRKIPGLHVEPWSR